MKKGQYIRTEAHKEQSRKKLLKWKEEGGVVWNKGLKGIHLNPETEFKRGRKDEQHPEWKGDDAGYIAIHSWVSRWKGRPDTCEKCGKSGLGGRFIQWANIDHKYNRVLDDYIRMCAKCHYAYDVTILNSKRGKHHE